MNIWLVQTFRDWDEEDESTSHIAVQTCHSPTLVATLW